MTPQERIAGRITRSDGHDLWTGKVDRYGHPVTKHLGRSTTVRRLVWELANGPLPPGATITACDVRACVRLDHLALQAPSPDATADSRGGNGAGSAQPRARRGAGSMRELRHGVWELTATVGQFEDGTPRRLYKTVRADNATVATQELATFVAETRSAPRVVHKALRDMTFDEALEMYLSEHLGDEKGRASKTVSEYRKLHAKWFSPQLGQRPARQIDEAALDREFGRMRKAGLSHSRLNHAKSLYQPFFRWAKSRQIITRNPMIEFQLPTSKQVSRTRTPPEVEELTLLLGEAVKVVPEIAPILVLGAVTGMRRGELVGVRRDRILWSDARLVVDDAIDQPGKVKATKTRRERTFALDADTLGMLRRHCDQMDDRAASCGTSVAPAGFVFSLDPACSTPMPPGYLTKRVAALKDHLGIAEKAPATLALEEEAVRLYRQAPASRRQGMTGPMPKGGLSYRAIGERLHRSDRWVALAVQAAERRDAAAERGLNLDFDGSVLALRKFTSSELLDSGFNISMVAQRQGHGPQVLMKHYSKARRSADRKAAEHLGRVVHSGSTTPVRSETTRRSS